MKTPIIINVSTTVYVIKISTINQKQQAIRKVSHPIPE